MKSRLYAAVSGFEEKKTSYLLLAVSGALFSVGFTFKECWFFSWMFFTPLAISVFFTNKASKRVLSSLFCFFFVFYVCCYSWLISMYPLDFAGLGSLESILVIALGLILIPLVHGTLMSFSIWLLNKLCEKCSFSVIRSLGVSFGYVLGEFLQGFGYLGFPWARMYVSQRGNIYNLQSAKLFGSYFITFIVVFFGCMTAQALVSGKNRKKYALTAALIFLLNFTFGVVCVKVTEMGYDKTSTVNVAALQGNISSYEKWDSLQNSYERYLILSEQAAKYCKDNGIDCDIALVPETAFPSTAVRVVDGTVTKGTKLLDVSALLSKTMSCPVLSGTFTQIDQSEYNSLVCVNSYGEILGVYNKQKLVPFGEFVPYRSFISVIFPLLSDINMLSSDLAFGENQKPIDVSGIKTACLICFDSVFGDCVREQIKNGGDIIAVSTNDSWYKRSKALEQHAAHSVMRAIENHRPLVRSANTGISMIVEPTGKIVEQTEILETSFIVGKLHKQNIFTLYTDCGDLTLYFSFAFFGVMSVWNVSKKIRRRAW